MLAPGPVDGPTGPEQENETTPERIRAWRSKYRGGDTMVKRRNKDREFRVIFREFPISFWFAWSFPCIRTHKRRALALPLALWLDKLCRFGPIANPRPFCVLA